MANDSSRRLSLALLLASPDPWESVESPSPPLLQLALHITIQWRFILSSVWLFVSSENKKVESMRIGKKSFLPSFTVTSMHQNTVKKISFFQIFRKVCLFVSAKSKNVESMRIGRQSFSPSLTVNSAHHNTVKIFFSFFPIFQRICLFVCLFVSIESGTTRINRKSFPLIYS